MSLPIRDAVAVFAAQIMMRQYGAEAQAKAETCVEQMRAKGDRTNAARWAAILRSIREFEAEEQATRIH